MTRWQVYRARPYHQYCVRTFGLPCVHGPGVRHATCEVMGPARGYSDRMIDDAMRTVVNVPAEQREAIRDRMARWGECLWHACARVWRKPCSCAACSNPEDPRHPWLIRDPEVAS